MKKFKLVFLIIIVLFLVVFGFGVYNENQEIRTIKNNKDLYSAYNESYSYEIPLYQQILTLPFSIMISSYDRGVVYNQWNEIDAVYEDTPTNGIKDSKTTGAATKDYSKTKHFFSLGIQNGCSVSELFLLCTK